MYKLISVDLDGTLLNDNKEITSASIAKINDLISQGIMFVITTGRPFTGTKRFSDLFIGDNPVILYNGAVIRMSRSDNILFQVMLEDSDAKKITDIIKEKDGTYIYWKEEVPYTNRIDHYVLDYVKISKLMPKEDPGNYHNITKIIWYNDSEKLKEYEKTLFNDLVNVNHFTSDPTYLEFVPRGISKGEALKKVCEYYDVRRDEVIAFGDANNDISTLEYAGVGVAMGNAQDKVKEAADRVTFSNNNEGVLKVLNEIYKK